MKLRHYDFDGRARFITFGTHRGLPLLVDDEIRTIICRVINRIRQENQFQLLAYVIMPEHIHLVIQPTATTKVGATVGEIKRISGIDIHHILETQKSPYLSQLTVIRNRAPRFVFWQRRCYDHNCRTEDSLWEKVNYCHNNPVKRKLVDMPEKWRWSSYRWYAGLDDIPLRMDYSG